MRIIGIIPSEKQVGALIDSLRNIGLDRKDIIVSDINKTGNRESAMDNVFIKTETESISDTTPFNELLKNKADRGIIVAVETSRHNTNRIREVMEQSGAVEIFQD